MGLFKKHDKVLCRWNKDILRARNILNKRPAVENYRKGGAVDGWFNVKTSRYTFTIWCRVGFKRFSQRPIWVSYNFGNMAKVINENESGGPDVKPEHIARTLAGEISNSRLSRNEEFLIVDDPCYATSEWGGVCPIATAFQGAAQNIAKWFSDNDIDANVEYERVEDWIPAYEYALKHRHIKNLIGMIFWYALALASIVSLFFIPPTNNLWVMLPIILIPVGALVGIVYTLKFLDTLLRKKKYAKDVQTVLDED